MLGEICLSVYMIIRVFFKWGKVFFLFLKIIILILEDCNMNYII